MLRAALTLAVLAVLALPALPAGAQPLYATITNPTGTSLWLSLAPGGLVLLGPGQSVSVPLPGAACVAPDYIVIYKSFTERLALRGWLKDGALASEGSTCIELAEPGVYTPYYTIEYLVAVKSEPEGLVEYYTWAERGSLAPLSVPEILNSGDAVYRFKFWKGAPLPAEPNVTLPVVGPTSLTAIYDAEYHVVVRLEPLGERVYEDYMPAGSVLTLNVPPIIYEGEDVRYVVSQVFVNGVPLDRAAGEGVVRVSGPTEVVVFYRTQYRVAVETPVGVSEQWADPGSRVTVEAPRLIEVNSTARLVFSGWLNLNATTPRVVVTVEGPATYTAVYEREYLVSFTSPLGSWEQWAREGSVVPIVQPERIPGIVYDRVLAYYIVNGDIRPPTRGGILLLHVTGPATVTAVYVTKPNVVHMALLAGFVLSVAALYLAYQAFQAERRGAAAAGGAGPVIVGPGGGGSTD